MTSQRALGAVRLSAMTDETTSPERQREQITLTAKTRGNEIVYIAEDLDVSGAVSPFDRADLGPWLTDPAKIGQWQVLIVAKMDRLSRSLDDLLALVKWLQRNHKTLISVAESIDLSTSHGKMFVQLLGMFAEFERSRISERRAEAAVKLRQEARWGGGRVPYGYVVEGNGHGYVLVPNPPERAVIRRAADQVIGGTSVTAICRALNADGIRSQSGKPWNVTVMLRILRSPVIRGYLVNEGEIVRDAEGMPVTREGLIDDDTWMRLQAALDANASPGSGIVSDASLLLQVAFCGHCEQPLYKMVRKGRGYSYLQCRTRRTGGKCQGKSVRMNVLEDLIVSALMDAAGTVPMREKIVIPAEDSARELAKVTESMAQIEATVISGTMPPESAARMLSGLEAKQAALKATKSKPERVTYEETGEKFAELWAALDDAGRHAFLISSEIRVTVGGFAGPAVPMNAAALADRMISLPLAGDQLVTIDLGSLAELRDMAAKAA